MVNLICPECDSPMKLKWSEKYKKSYYGCTAYPKCKCTHGAHEQNGLPKGSPGDGPTRKARLACHDLIDPLWKDKHMSRKNVYRLLSKLMDLPTEDAHIGSFSLEQCETFIKRFKEWVTDKKPELRFIHLFTSDLRKMQAKLKDGTMPSTTVTVEEIDEELSRRFKKQRTYAKGKNGSPK